MAGQLKKGAGDGSAVANRNPSIVKRRKEFSAS
jgi:hypothetical protein